MFARHQLQQNKPLRGRRRGNGGNSCGLFRKLCRLEFFVALNLLMLGLFSMYGSKPATHPGTVPYPRLRGAAEGNPPPPPQELLRPHNAPPRIPLREGTPVPPTQTEDPMLSRTRLTLKRTLPPQRDDHATLGSQEEAMEELPLEERSEDSRDAPLPPLFGEEQAPPPAAPGVVVLGMHRSGTSLLAGLLFRAGLWVGERRDLIWGADAADNSKGFYERTDIVLQNDALMKLQKVHWSLFSDRFNSSLATSQHAQGLVDWSYGQAGLAKLGASSKHGPWLLKDPRLCLSLAFWIPLLSSPQPVSPPPPPTSTATNAVAAADDAPSLTLGQPSSSPGGGISGGDKSRGATVVAPALLFTYRHPAEVAKSLQKREGFGIKRGLLLWLSYNQRALASSSRLCRVSTSNAKLNAAPLQEVNRVVLELVERCGVDVPRAVTEKDVKEFVDPSLQRNHVAAASIAASPMDSSSAGAGGGGAAVGAEDFPVVGGGGSVASRRGEGVPCEREATWASFGFVDATGSLDLGDEATVGGRRKGQVLKAALNAFCDMESGRAFSIDVDPGGQNGPFYTAPLDWG